MAMFTALVLTWFTTSERYLIFVAQCFGLKIFGLEMDLLTDL